VGPFDARGRGGSNGAQISPGGQLSSEIRSIETTFSKQISNCVFFKKNKNKIRQRVKKKKK
jgi:hypothetical protein